LDRAFASDIMVHKIFYPQHALAKNIAQSRDPLTSPSSVPWPGSTYVIRHDSSGHVLALLNGNVILVQPGNKRASIHWECVENKGWLGFREPVSGLYLGYDMSGNLICQAKYQQGWENFVVRPRPDGGYVLFLTHWEKLWPVGLRTDHDGETLAKMESGTGSEFAWEFVKA
jgi:hypothetical protein